MTAMSSLEGIAVGPCHRALNHVVGEMRDDADEAAQYARHAKMVSHDGEQDQSLYPF